MENYPIFETLLRATTFIGAILTLGVVAWQSWETRKSAHIAQKQLEISSRPYLTFGKPHIIDNGHNWIFTLPICNTGSIPANYKPKIGMLNDKILSLPDGSTCVFQGKETDVSVGIEKNQNAKGVITLEFEYWPLGKPDFKFSRRRSMKINLAGRETLGEIIEDWAN